MNYINFLNLLIAEKSVPLARINHILSILQNHSYFILDIWFTLLLIITIIYVYYGFNVDESHCTDYQKLIKGKHIKIAFCAILIYMMISTALSPLIAHPDYAITLFPFQIKPSTRYICTTIKHNVTKIPYERHEIELYHHSRINPIAREKLPHVEHLLNKHIKYDNNHIKDIHTPMINHKFHIVTSHTNINSSHINIYDKLKKFAHTSYNPDHPNQTKSNSK